MKKLLTVLLIFTSLPIFSTHIVGGDLNYRYISGNQYEVTLDIFYDCIYGSPLAISQDIDLSYLGFFRNSDNTLFASRNLNGIGPDSLGQINYQCIIPPGNVCAVAYRYTTIIDLPSIPGGYRIAFQRCCRNETILNIVNPGSTGATFEVFIPERNTFGENSNPVFNDRPPIYLCVGFPFTFDHSASDLDGDSLIYELCDPLNGAHIGNATKPTPANFTVSPAVNWSPGYNTNNMLGTNPPFSIDPVTGIISATPEGIGQYVVGICVSEYRNGVYLGTTKRDYQFNVIACEFEVVSAFVVPEFTCTFTVQFNNESEGAEFYIWNFGDSLSGFDTLAIQNPSYTYSGPGVYDVTLVAGDINCTDTFRTTVTIFNDFSAFAGNDTAICLGDTIYIGALDTTGFASTYIWSPNEEISDINIPNPYVYPSQSRAYIIRRTLGLCDETDTIFVQVNEPPNVEFAFEPLPSCFGVTLQTINTTTGADSYSWFLEDELVSESANTEIFIGLKPQVNISLFALSGGCGVFITQPYTNNFTNPIILPAPNVFTPNGDGINDCWDVQSFVENLDCYEVFIYNRWGLLVYQSFEDGGCWNGKMRNKGGELTDGVYFYIIKSDFNDDETGNITLIR